MDNFFFVIFLGYTNYGKLDNDYSSGRKKRKITSIVDNSGLVSLQIELKSSQKIIFGEQ